MTEYKPGTVAEIGWRMTSGKERAMFDGWYWHTEGGVTVRTPESVRPLVVLDLGGDTKDTAALLREILSHWPYGVSHYNGGSHHLAQLADQIEAQTKPPRIPEPGLWGVVREGVDGDTYVRESFGTVRQWSRLGGHALLATWDEIKNPTLIREGVSE